LSFNISAGGPFEIEANRSGGGEETRTAPANPVEKGDRKVHWGVKAKSNRDAERNKSKVRRIEVLKLFYVG